MWEQYRKTFAGMQAVILVVAIAVYFVTGRSTINAAMCFAFMQLGSILGAAWAVRLKTKIAEKNEALPLRGRGL